MSLATAISNLPCAWRGLLKALCVKDWPLTAAETWLRQNQDSKYGDTLSWTALIEALCREEPVNCKGTLTFKPRLFHLPPSLQQQLVAIIHQYRQEICVKTLQRFVTVLQTDDMSTGWLRTYIGWLKWHCQSRCCTDRGTRDSSSYSFSPENQGLFRALCIKLSTVEHSPHKRIWRVKPCPDGGNPDSNMHTASSPAQALSPLPSSLPVVNDVETPSKAKPLTDASDSGHDIDSCASTNIEGVHKKRKLEEDAVTVDEHRRGRVEENDARETETVLDSDVQVQVDKLRELWEAGKEDPLPTKELTVFTQFPTETVKDVCIELAKSGLSEIAIATACKHLCGVSQEISQGNALVFASSLLLPTVLGLHGNASRSLLSAVIMFAGPFAKPLIEAVLVPCASSDKLGSNQIDLLSHVLKIFSPAQMKEFLRQFLSEKCPWNDSTSSLLLNILDLKVDMDCELLTMLVSALKSNGAAQMKGLKFAKVLLETINKYGKQLTATHVGQLTEILQHNESFLKKSALAALSKFQK